MAAVFGELWRRIRQPKGASTIRHVTCRAFPQICQVRSKDRKHLLLLLQSNTVHSTSKPLMDRAEHLEKSVRLKRRTSKTLTSAEQF